VTLISGVERVSPSRLLFLLVLVAGCAQRQSIEVKIEPVGCPCTPAWLELYLFRAGEGCARATSLAVGYGGEAVLSDTGTDLVALALVYSKGGADAGSRWTFYGKDGGLPGADAWTPDQLRLDKWPSGDLWVPSFDAPSPYVPDSAPSSCGNGKCESGESCKSCPTDCGACPTADGRRACICCYAASRVSVADPKATLPLKASGTCGVPGSALTQVGLPSSTSIPPSICP
jgi:hypothetical protein